MALALAALLRHRLLRFSLVASLVSSDFSNLVAAGSLPEVAFLDLSAAGVALRGTASFSSNRQQAAEAPHRRLNQTEVINMTTNNSSESTANTSSESLVNDSSESAANDSSESTANDSSESTPNNSSEIAHVSGKFSFVVTNAAAFILDVDAKSAVLSAVATLANVVTAKVSILYLTSRRLDVTDERRLADGTVSVSSATTTSAATSPAGVTAMPTEAPTGEPTAAAVTESSGSQAGAALGEQEVILLAVLVPLCGVCLLVGGCSSLAVAWRWRRGNVVEHWRTLERLEALLTEYEDDFRSAGDERAIFSLKVEELKRVGQPPARPILEEQETDEKRWMSFVSDHKHFLEGSYTVELRKRTEAQMKRDSIIERKRQADAAAPSRRVGNQRQQQEPEPPTMARVYSRPQDFDQGLVPRSQAADLEWFPRRPETSYKKLLSQLKSLELLRKRLFGIHTEFNTLVRKVFPQGLGKSHLQAMETDCAPRTGSFSKGPQICPEEVSAMELLSHPFLRRVKVRPLGLFDEVDVKPGSSQGAVLVDPAVLGCIARDNPKGGAGVCNTIYTWLGIKRVGRFPAEVAGYFHGHSEAREVDGRPLVKFHSYGEGQHVLHAVSPQVHHLLEGMRPLAKAYASMLIEYVAGLTAAEATSGNAVGRCTPPKVLRLIPLAWAILNGSKKLERHAALLTLSSLSVACMMLPHHVQEILKECTVEFCIMVKKESEHFTRVLDLKMEDRGFGADSLEIPNGLRALARQNGDYEWVRHKNGSLDRLARLAGALDTSAAIYFTKWSLKAGQTRQVVQLAPLTEMLSGTRIFRASDRSNAGAKKSAARTKIVMADPPSLTVIEVCRERSGAGIKTVGVNAASAYSVGGGVMHGGRHALEEAWCMTSTLLPSLLKVEADQHPADAAQPLAGPPMHIPVDCCILSPGVELFRAASSEGYRFCGSSGRDRTLRLQGVVSVAMFNMNPRVKDSPIDAPENFDEYCRLVKSKFLAVIAGALELGAEALVCPDIGCGVFENDPEVVGSLLGEALLELDGYFTEIVMTGKPRFYQAAKSVYESGVPSDIRKRQRPGYFRPVNR